MTVPLSATVVQAREWLRERLDDGAECPCCTQFAKVYRRKITSPMARVLIAMYREGGGLAREWVDLPALAGKMQTVRTRATGGDEAKLRYWGLIEAMPEVVRADGSPRTGMWRLTPGGVRFVELRGLVPKYARIYDGRCLGFVEPEMVSIRDALGTKFNYDELMAGV